MGTFAKNWSTLKTMIQEKDDAIDKLTTQLTAAQQIAVTTQKALDAANQTIAQLKTQLATLQSQFDAADQSAMDEINEVVADNPLPDGNAAPAVQPTPQSQAQAQVKAPAINPAPKVAAAPAVTTFTK